MPKLKGKTLKARFESFRLVGKGGKKKVAKAFNHGGSVYAWWNLSKAQKLALSNARKSGMFGGIPNVAPYMWVQEGSTPEGEAGAAAAAIRPTRFIEIALDSSENVVADIIDRAMANAG